MTRYQLKRWLFRTEMRIRSRLHLDYTGCLQREINDIGGATLPAGLHNIRVSPFEVLAKGAFIRGSGLPREKK